MGHPVGYCGRRLDIDAVSRWGKWRFPTLFPKGQSLYNAHRALSAGKRGIALVECPWAAMRITQAGIAGVFALLGTTISQIQLAWLAKAPAVLLLMDADELGRKASKTIAKALYRKTTPQRCRRSFVWRRIRPIDLCHCWDFALREQRSRIDQFFSPPAFSDAIDSNRAHLEFLALF